MTIEQTGADAGAPPRVRLLAEEILAAIALAVVIASVSWGVLTRYILERPANWTSELASICFAWSVFLGAAAAFARSENISIDAFINLLPDVLRRGVRIAADLFVLAVLVLVAFLAARFTLSTMDVPTTVLRVPQAFLYAGAAVGFILMSVRHAVAMASRRQSRG